jgi:hypothetical protein
MVLAALWVEGQGLHLAANSINNLAEELARDGTLDILNSSIYELTYYIDEHLSHSFWYLALLGLAALLVQREWRRPAGARTTWWAAVVAGLLYGFTYFCSFIEGQKVVMGLPFAAGLTLWTLIRGRKRLSKRPVLAFFFIACLVATLLFGYWGLRYGGFPEFTEVGII